MSDEEIIEQLELEVKVLQKNNKGLKSKIDELQKEIERLEARKYMLNAETGEISQIPIDNNYISKDKIKAKIEEFKIVIDTILENEKEFNRPMMTYDLKRNDYCEKMLQSLLEKE